MSNRAATRRVWCALISNKIFYGSVCNETGKVVGVKKDITGDALRAVAEHLFNQPRVLSFVLNSGRILSVKVCVTDSEAPDNSVENAAHDLLHAMQRMVNQFYAAGIESKEESLNPMEEALYQAEQAIAKATGTKG
ncbi:hypothetical protein CO695_13685 [Providencia alcalifaciens]|uniref:Uncharacterized protein n=1 Tax=Providencia alcalifaciens DSM 30120 TaxID=520999 RepID=B6XEW5_9GAMM|nr:hypothetical protein [Providencia alcalifaciens]ATG17295.1 hypothetical protein CO695_13685 [Providencia alcalifaciens]EEB46053.1 hypothetical protein PROVALCAL_01896 [Providencia alcalifaciens DSM 30120]SQI37545.1 Uncharacterised protein [Providencia alcalifaciens]